MGEGGRDVLEERRHSPFQVLDASAIEGIRGLAGESSSIYSCIQIYKALTPPAPPAYRGATEGPGPPSYVGSSEERPCPDLGLCAPPSAPAGTTVWGWASPPPDGSTCRVKPRLKSPPAPPRRPAYGLPRPCAARGAADGLPHVLPCHPLSHCCVPVPALPAHGGKGGCAAPGGEVDHPVPDTPDPEQQPLAAPVPAAQHSLQHPAAPDPALQYPAAPVRGGVGRHLDPAQLEAALQAPAARNPAEEGDHPASLLPAPLQ